MICLHCGVENPYIGRPDEDGDLSCYNCARPKARQLQPLPVYADARKNRVYRREQKRESA